MDSGAYTIQEFICQTCDAYLGWKFARAHDGPERWKENHSVLELELVAAHDDDGSMALPTPASSASSSSSAQYQQLPQDVPPVHKRTMSADPRPVGAAVMAKGLAARQGVRSLQASPKPAPAQAQMQRRPGVEDFEDGPFWAPR